MFYGFWGVLGLFLLDFQGFVVVSFPVLPNEDRSCQGCLLGASANRSSSRGTTLGRFGVTYC